MNINELLGLKEDYKISSNDAFEILTRFKTATFNSDKKISNISFIYYSDTFGDFLKPKKHLDVIVKDMFDNLPSEDQFELLSYFNER